MTCEEDLLAQVQLSAADAARNGNPGQRYYVYRNSIKALSWFSSVRELLVDPAYAAWFLPFSATPPINGSRYYSPPCDLNYDPPLCSALFHDQTQSPAFPKGDGDCAAPACDTGAVPSGEYVSARAPHVSGIPDLFLSPVTLTRARPARLLHAHSCGTSASSIQA